VRGIHRQKGRRVARHAAQRPELLTVLGLCLLLVVILVLILVLILMVVLVLVVVLVLIAVAILVLILHGMLPFFVRARRDIYRSPKVI
jgi:hypothetical protein